MHLCASAQNLNRTYIIPDRTRRETLRLDPGRARSPISLCGTSPEWVTTSGKSNVFQFFIDFALRRSTTHPFAETSCRKNAQHHLPFTGEKNQIGKPSENEGVFSSHEPFLLARPFLDLLSQGASDFATFNGRERRITFPNGRQAKWCVNTPRCMVAKASQHFGDFLPDSRKPRLAVLHHPTGGRIVHANMHASLISLYLHHSIFVGIATKIHRLRPTETGRDL